MGSELREVSPITWAFERAFWLFQYLSPANVIFRTRADYQRGFDKSNAWRLTVERSRAIEAYILLWILVEIALVRSVLGSTPAATQIFSQCLSAFRIFEILQSAINIAVFDPLRATPGTHRVATVTRSIILFVWNYFEIIVCFGILYGHNLGLLRGAEDWTDALYFSAVTQLTIGYGDILPTGAFKIVAAVQGTVGFFFGLLVLSRFIASLPPTKPVLQDQ